MVKSVTITPAKGEATFGFLMVISLLFICMFQDMALYTSEINRAYYDIQIVGQMAVQTLVI